MQRYTNEIQRNKNKYPKKKLFNKRQKITKVEYNEKKGKGNKKRKEKRRKEKRQQQQQKPYTMERNIKKRKKARKSI